MNAADPKTNKKMQSANKVPSGYAARLLLVVVGMGIRRAESRRDMVQCPLFNPGFLSLQGDAPQAEATSLLGGSSPLAMPILELGVVSLRRQTP